VIKDNDFKEQLKYNFNISDGVSATINAAQGANNLLNYAKPILQLEGIALLASEHKTPV
jgi:hypothetical protein